jgi:hypothetical protein
MEATPEALGDQVTVLAGALRECVAAVEFVRSDPAEAQRHARKLMALMAELLGGALLVEEAGEALTRGDGRKALIARWYLERHFAPPARRGILPGQDWGQAHFEALIRYEPVAPSATPARRAAG